MLSTLAAIAFLEERPTPIALGGIVLIAVGIFLFTQIFLWARVGKVQLYSLSSRECDRVSAALEKPMFCCI